ncbi:MAG: hypothetical protein ACPHCJ_13100 [Oceanococcaceae bacterium]
MSVTALEKALGRAKASGKTYVIALDTDPQLATANDHVWWDVGQPEVSERKEVEKATKNSQAHRAKQPY